MFEGKELEKREQKELADDELCHFSLIVPQKQNKQFSKYKYSG